MNEQYVLVELTNGRHKSVVKGSWNTIVEKMEGAGKSLFENESRKKINRRMYNMTGIVFSTTFIYYMFEVINKAFGG